MDHGVWRPSFYDPSIEAQREALAALRAGGAVWAEHDTIQEQLLGLVEARNPRLRELPVAQRGPALEERVVALLDGRPLEHYGQWVHYPWSGQLVHLLSREDFRELRLDRNRNKITTEEQNQLRERTIGIVGLSVGNAVALTLALEGIGGHLKLADFDHLELGNMNRLRAGTHQISLPKTVLAARQILEIDPWLELTLFSEGVNADNMEAFFLGDPPLDVLVEECDSVDVKFLLRERARSLRIPVVMETSDRGMLDVERFDQAPDRPLFHGLVPGVSSGSLAGLSTEEKVSHVLRIVGAESVSARMGASLLEIERSISTWPQLGSDVVLGGASVAVAVRRLALGEPVVSGRRMVDLQEQMTRAQYTTVPDPVAPAARPVAEPPSLSPLLAELLTEACLAPSGGNAQPWHFHVDGEEVWISLHPERSRSVIDHEQIAAVAAIGAVLENLRIAAAHRDHHILERPVGDDEAGPIVACVRVCPGPPEDAEALRRLHAPLRARHTNRRVAASAPLTEDEIAALHHSVGPGGARLDLVTDPEALCRLAVLLGENDRLRLLNPSLGREMMGELHFAPTREVEVGIALETCDLSESQQVALQMMSRAEVRREVLAMGGGQRLIEMTQQAVETSAGVGLLSLSGSSRARVRDGGGSMQRVWLEATALGLGFQPVGSLSYMIRLLSTCADEVYDEAEQVQLTELGRRLRAFFPDEAAAGVSVLLFRVHRGRPASARSGRLPLAHCVSLGRPEGAR